MIFTDLNLDVVWNFFVDSTYPFVLFHKITSNILSNKYKLWGSHQIAPSKFTSAPVRICKKDDLIFCVRATLGNIVFSDKEYCLGRGVAALRPYPFFRCFSYFKLAEAMEHFNNTLSGSIMIEITKDQLLNFPLEIPSREKLEEFEALVSPTIEKFKLLQQENGLLESKKHFLLPLLLD